MTLITTVETYFQKVGIISDTKGLGFRPIFGDHYLTTTVPNFMPFCLKSTRSIPGVPKSQLTTSLTLILKSHLLLAQTCYQLRYLQAGQVAHARSPRTREAEAT